MKNYEELNTNIIFKIIGYFHKMYMESTHSVSLVPHSVMLQQNPFTSEIATTVNLRHFIL